MRHGAKDILGRVYEYFLGKFAGRRGQDGRRVLHAALASSGCWSRCSSRTRAASTTRAAARAACSCSREKFVAAHGGRRGDIADLRPGVQPDDLAAGEDEPRHPRHRRQPRDRARPTRFHRDLHPDLRADFILANPPFNMSRLGRRAHSATTRAGSTAPRPPATPTSPGSSTSSTTSPRTRHRRLRAGQRLDVVQAVRRGRDPHGHRRGRPGRLHGRAAGAAVLLDARSRSASGSWLATRQEPAKARSGSATGAAKTLFIDARKLGTMVDRTHRELTDDGHRAASPAPTTPGAASRTRDVRRRARLLQVPRRVEGDPQARLRADARSIRRRRRAPKQTTSRSRRGSHGSRLHARRSSCSEGARVEMEIRLDARLRSAVAEWRTAQLGDLVTITSGGTPSKGRCDYWGGDIPWVSAKDMHDFRLADAVDRSRTMASPPARGLPMLRSTLLLVRGMTLHSDIPISVAMVPLAFNQDVKALTARDDLEPSYLAYWLIANKPTLARLVDSASHGTGRINTPVLRGVQVRYPPLGEQRAIARSWARSTTRSS